MMKKIGLYGRIVYALMVWTIFQEFILGILYHFIHIPYLIKGLFFTKDILLVLLYIIALARTKFPRGLIILQLFYLPFVIIGTITSISTNRVSVLTVLSSTRGLVLLPAFVTIGYSIRKNNDFIELIKHRYMRLLVIVAIAGIIDYVLDILVGTKEFWTDFVQLGTYMKDIKGAEVVVSSNGLPGNFYTYAANGAYTQKRLVSFWAHPLTSGYVLVIPFMYYFLKVVFANRNKQRCRNIVYLGFITVALILTFTRGTILPAMLLVILCLLYRYRTEGEKFILYISVLLIAFFAGMVIYREKIFGYIYNGSTSAHLISLSSAIGQVGFIGRGAGTFAAATSEGIWTESTYVSVAGQLGIIAVFFYILLFLYPVLSIFKTHRKQDLLVVSIALSGVVFFFSGIISEQLCAYTAIAPYYIIAGASLRNVKYRKNALLDRIYQFGYGGIE